MKQDFEYRCRQCCRVEELFAQLQELQELLLRETGELRKSEAGRPVRLAKQYVMQHFHEPITLEDVLRGGRFQRQLFQRSLQKRDRGRIY